jgi:hypothetical protein
MLQMINFDNLAGQTNGTPAGLGVNNAKTSTDFYQHPEKIKKDKEVQLPKVNKKSDHSQDLHTDPHHYEDREPKM